MELQWPVANDYRITQYYHSGHKAVDIAPRIRGTKGIHLYSPVKGRVTDVVYARWRWNWRKDQWIQIKDEQGNLHYLGHMVKGSPTVKVGQFVEVGQVVGIMGTTGYSSGIHTHYRIRVNGRNVNPIDFFAAHGIQITNIRAIYPTNTFMQYVVKKGDTLAKIARKHALTLKSIKAMNPQINNPNVIFPGQKVYVGGTAAKVHVVKRGDNMYNIARAYSLPYSKLIALNPQIKNPALILPGQKVNIG